jgi:hypothetical protein
MVICDVIPNPRRTRLITEAHARGTVSATALECL